MHKFEFGRGSPQLGHIRPFQGRSTAKYRSSLATSNPSKATGRFMPLKRNQGAMAEKELRQRTLRTLKFGGPRNAWLNIYFIRSRLLDLVSSREKSRMG
ncbi:hypothetical protein TNCT_32351 [Trichonephila clavata]|uniref:Uncharacterized protein n=1 Tax=Trichonephila clavata TaxID=2740835 RepID=A0A8X6L350_TRICU|nr:hypothetical protein TNCT_32351 [Trichonephila clavata]